MSNSFAERGTEERHTIEETGTVLNVLARGHGRRTSVVVLAQPQRQSSERRAVRDVPRRAPTRRAGRADGAPAPGTDTHCEEGAACRPIGSQRPSDRAGAREGAWPRSAPLHTM